LRWTLAAAASVVVVIASGLLLTSEWHGRTASESDEFVTKTGEQIQIKLKDGSQVWLGGKSRLAVAFTKESRVVRLEAGEAFFSVKKDRQRRFRVHTASGDITAVGTAFDVRSVADRVTVSVTEGVVSVASGTGAHTGPETQAASVRIGVGQQAVIDARQLDQAPKVTQNSIPGERARWREGSLVYRDEPLRDVVADVARYSDKPLEIADESVGDLHYSGVVNKSAIEEWAVALHESFPVKIEVNDGRLIIKSL
jgi:transmembrane sensor